MAVCSVPYKTFGTFMQGDWDRRVRNPNPIICGSQPQAVAHVESRDMTWIVGVLSWLRPRSQVVFPAFLLEQAGARLSQELKEPQSRSDKTADEPGVP